MKGIITFTILLASAASAGAFTVADKATHEALPGASVFNKSGSILGITDELGRFTRDASADYPLTVRYIGFEPQSVAAATDSVELTAAALPLSEVTVSDRVDGVHLICYMREYSSGTSATDTSTVFAERMVDYIIPLRDDVKKFKSITSPRTLVQCVYSRHTDNKGLDTVTIANESDLLPWTMFCTIDDTELTEPESLRGLQTGSDTLTTGKHPVVLRKGGGTMTVTTDYLADKKDHVWSPNVLKLLGMTTDFSRITRSRVYPVSDNGRYPIGSLALNSFTMQATGRGKLIRHALNSENPVEMYTLIEAYPVDCRYITAEESRELHKNPPTGVKPTVPATAPPLDPVIRRIIDRAQ